MITELNTSSAVNTQGIISGMQSAKSGQELKNFQSYLEGLIESGKDEKRTPAENAALDGSLSTSEIGKDGRLPGDVISSFIPSSSVPADTKARPSGAAANSGSADPSRVRGTEIDKTSKLYEKSLELESYVVKIMLSSMRSTITRSSLTGDDNSYARQMYEDMLYDEMAVSMTKNAGFGLADQVYLQLKG